MLFQSEVETYSNRFHMQPREKSVLTIIINSDEFTRVGRQILCDTIRAELHEQDSEFRLIMQND